MSLRLGLPSAPTPTVTRRSGSDLEGSVLNFAFYVPGAAPAANLTPHLLREVTR